MKTPCRFRFALPRDLAAGHALRHLGGAADKLLRYLLELAPGRVVGRRDNGDIAIDAVDVATDRITDKSVLEGGALQPCEHHLFRGERCFCISILDELHADKKAPAADIADVRVLTKL